MGIHANGKTMWSKGKMMDGHPEGYWEWYRVDGTVKRSGYFEKGEPVGEWITYDNQGQPYPSTQRGGNKVKINELLLVLAPIYI